MSTYVIPDDEKAKLENVRPEKNYTTLESIIAEHIDNLLYDEKVRGILIDLGLVEEHTTDEVIDFLELIKTELMGFIIMRLEYTMIDKNLDDRYASVHYCFTVSLTTLENDTLALFEVLANPQVLIKQLEEYGKLKATSRVTLINLVNTYPPEDIIIGGYTEQELINVGYTPEQVAEFFNNIITYKDMRDCGYSSTEMRENNVTLTDLLTAGYSPQEALVGGYTEQELLDVGYPPEEVAEYVSTINIYDPPALRQSRPKRWSPNQISELVAMREYFTNIYGQKNLIDCPMYFLTTILQTDNVLDELIQNSYDYNEMIGTVLSDHVQDIINTIYPIMQQESSYHRPPIVVMEDNDPMFNIMTGLGYHQTPPVIAETEPTDLIFNLMESIGYYDGNGRDERGEREELAYRSEYMKQDTTLTTGFTCPACSSTYIAVNLIQTRSNDEPLTLVIMCNSCGTRITSSD